MTSYRLTKTKTKKSVEALSDEALLIYYIDSATDLRFYDSAQLEKSREWAKNEILKRMSAYTKE